LFKVGLTRDFLRADGSQAFADIDTSALDVGGVAWACLSKGGAGEELPPAQMADLDAVLVLAPLVTESTLAGADRLAVVARLGVGYDSVDVEACTRQGVALTITPDGVRRPVASAALAFLLALAHKLPLKDRLTREGRWSEKAEHMGIGLRGRTLGLVGFGSIGGEISRLVSPHEMRIVAADPFAAAEAARDLGVELVSLDELLASADFVIVCCSLTPETLGLPDQRRARADRRSVGADFGAARGCGCRRRPRCVRAGAGGTRRTAAGLRQRDRGAACPVVDK